MFVRDAEGVVDNTTPRAVNAWLEAVDRVRPGTWTSIRSRARRRAIRCRRPPRPVLEAIAAQVAALGIRARVIA